MTQLQVKSAVVERPLISVMMPAYNAGLHISAAIDSVINQSYSNWELIVVDDGSTDNTQDIIKKYAAADGRVKPIFAKHGGRGKARNLCLANCGGDFIAMLDSDDIAISTRFEKQADFLLNNPDIAAVGGQCYSFTDIPVADAGKVIPWPTSPDVVRSWFDSGKMGIANCAAMVRKDVFKKYGAYDERLLRAQDYGFFRRLVSKGVALAALPDFVLFYRQENLIPSIKYFVDSQMFRKYADYLLSGGNLDFSERSKALEMRLYEQYLRAKYVYFYTKLKFMYRNAK